MFGIGYTKSCLLGEGTCSAVWKGTVTGYKGPVALKIVKEAYLHEVDGEIGIHSALPSHPSILKYFGCKRQVHSAIIILELFEGKDLHEAYLRPKNQLPLKAADNLFKQAGAGFAFLKAQKVIHGDVKPSNLLWNGRVLKIIDFGIAHKDGITKKDNRIMSFPYRAPELVHKLDFTETVDVWALACIVHEMVTNQRLFSVKEVCPQFSDWDGRRLSAAHERVIGHPPPERFKRSTLYPYPAYIGKQLVHKDLENYYREWRKDENDELGVRFARLVRTCIQWDIPSIEKFNECLHS
jgi:serine/threonine protein kinase